jgi:predicted TIM-barrel fold metal-dependent hydrolase
MAATPISADSHVVEPREVFDAVAERFGERAPRIIDHPQYGDFLVAPETDAGHPQITGHPGLPVGRVGIAGRRLDDPETEALMRQGYAGIRPGIMNPDLRVKDQDLDGVAAELLYPSLFFRVFSIAENDVLLALFRSYNEWLMDYCARQPGRLIGLALLPMQDPAAALSELQFALKRGFRGGCIPCTAPGSLPYHDRAYDPVWTLAQEAQFPLSLHIFTGAHAGQSGLQGVDSITAYASAPVIVQITLSDLICQGVAERFPDLNFVVVEFNTGWIANWLERLDHAFYRSRASAPAELHLKPSEYWQRQFYATFEDDRAGILTRDAIGVQTLMWGNDFPHHDSVWPHSRETLDEIFEGVPDDVRYRTTAGNVSNLYQLKVRV